jgi:hypothetical protein
MRIKNNITRTLKKALFEAPNPPRYNKEYHDLMDFIFPGKELFVAFLDEENFEQQTNLAEKILLRLSYDSFFAPPTRLLFNVLIMETQIAGEKKEGYIGRDHFVHLVHLYLLGIYLFLYHHIFNENILVLFKNKRSKINIPSQHLSRSILKDSVVAWRYFVLFHDISYPIEYFLGNKEVSLEKRGSYLKAYNKIAKSIGKDLSLRSLSKFIGVYKLIKNASEFSFENLIIPHVNDETKTILEEKTKAGFNQIEKIYGYETIRSVYSIFDRKNILPVLYEKNTMLPILIYVPTSSGGDFEVYKTIHFNNNSSLKKLITINDGPFDKDYFYLKNHQWGFFIDKTITLHSLVNDIFPNITLDDFDKTINYIHDLTSSHYTMVISDSSFKQYCFDIYTVLYKLVGYLNSEDNISEKNMNFDHLASVIGNIGREIPSKISDIIKNLLNDKLKNIDFENDMDEQSSLSEIVLSYLSKISDNYDGFASAIAIPLKSEIQMQYELKKNLDKIRVSIGGVFKSKRIKTKISLNIKNSTIHKEKLLAEDNTLVNDIIDNINRRTSKMNLESFAKVLEYKPHYPKIRESFFDHGINSCIVFLSVINIYEQLLNIKKDPDFQKLLKVAIGLDVEKDKKYVDYKFRDIFSESCFAILTHNIYPKYSFNPGFRTKLESSPFSYFAILTDSLQQWDRKFLVNQGLNELPYSTLSKSFNIEVVNKKIRISEYDARLNIQKSLLNLKNGIDDFLEKASDYIELNLAEF